MYFKKGRIKLAIALAKGKKPFDKRETIRRREADRETRAAVKTRPGIIADDRVVKPPPSASIAPSPSRCSI